jgi:hypothetical protein
LKAALGDDADNVAVLVKHAAQGKQYHAKLMDDVVKAERLAGLIPGDDEATIKDARALIADWPVERLEKYLARVTAMSTKGAQLQGGDPNATGANANDGKPVDASNPMTNKAVTG